MAPNNTTTVVIRQPPWLLEAAHRQLYRCGMAPEKTASATKAVALTPFNRRAREAYDLGVAAGKFRTQAELASRLGCRQQNISKLLGRRSHSSEFAVRFANICGVSPLWLESGEGQKHLARDSLSDRAVLVAIAWSFLAAPLAERIAIESIESGLSAMPLDHSARRELERLLKELRKGREISKDLSPPSFSRHPHKVST